MRRWAVLVALTALVVSTVGCGSTATKGGARTTGISSVQFASRANAACIAAAGHAAATLSRLTGSNSAEELAAILKAAQAVRELTAGLAVIPAPVPQQSEFAGGIALLRRLATSIERFHGALANYVAGGQREPSPVSAATADLESIAVRLSSTASALGLGACNEIIHAEVGNSSTSPAATPSPSEPPAAAVWHFKWTQGGGYHYSAVLSVSKPEHIQDAVIAPCTANAASDTEIRAVVTETNETKNFPGQPGLVLHDVGPQKVPVAQENQCHELDEESSEGKISVVANENIPPGSSITGRFVLILPEYYSPEHPNGDTSLLKEYSFSPFGYSPNVNGLGSVGTGIQITGPSVESFGSGDQRFSLAGLVP